MGVTWPAGSGRVFVLAAAFAVLVALGSNPAAAMQLSPQQKADMKLHYDKATRAYDVGKYQEAIEEYQKAYEIGGDAAMIYNIAQAYRLSDQLTEAIRFYRRYLQRSPNAPNREIVERRVAELEKVVEERKKGPSNGSALPVPPPTPPVTATPMPTPAPPAPLPPPPPPTYEPPPAPIVPMSPAVHRSRVVHAVVGAALMGLVGGGFGAVAIWQGKLAQEKADKLTSESMATNNYFNPTVETNGKNANKLAIVFGIGSALAVVGGAIVLMTMPSASSGSPAPEAPATTHNLTPSVAPVVGVGVIGAGAGWSF